MRSRLIHAITDLCLGTLVGVSVGTSVAASVIFGVSRQQGFDKHIANTLAGSMFDVLGWPVFGLACVAMVGCLYSVLRPPLPATRKDGVLAWKLMAGASVLVVVCALATQVYFAPRMKDLRQNSTWVNGELVDPAEKAEFGRMHGWSFGVAGLATLLCAGLLVGRRLVVGRAGVQP
jgi:hypothetical protein